MSWYALAWGAILPITWYVEVRLDQTIRGHQLPYNLEPLIWMVLIGLVTYPLVVGRMYMLKKKAVRDV